MLRFKHLGIEIEAKEKEIYRSSLAREWQKGAKYPHRQKPNTKTKKTKRRRLGS
jgi:hypothetical protein